MIRFFRFALTLLGLVLLALLAAITTMRFAIHGTEVKVPDFRGLTINEASHRALDYGLNLSVDNRFYSTDVPADYVLTQSPAAGTIVRREWHVRISQSLGPQRVSIPNAVGRQERIASLDIRRLGLDVGTVAHLPSTIAPAGTVIAQDPQPNAGGVERPSVSLLLADPPSAPDNGYVMPDLVGQQEAAASAAIFRAGLKLAPAQKVVLGVTGSPANSPEQDTPAPAHPELRSDGQPAGASAATAPAATSFAATAATLNVPPGTVVAQRPTPGHRVDAAVQIELTVAE